MKTWFFLLCAIIPPAIANAGELSTRIEYTEQTAPNGVIFKMMVSQYVDRPNTTVLNEGDRPSRVDQLWSQLNIHQLSNGVWTFPKEMIYSKEQAAELVGYFAEINTQAETRVQEMWRVLACPLDRARPLGDDAYLAIEVIQDAKDVLWEQLRQQAVRRHGEIIVELTDKHRKSMGMKSIRHHMKEAWKHRDDPDGLLSDLCYGRGLF